MPKETEELQKLTVAALRERAKKELGRGVSKLRTKAQLIAALLGGGVAASAKRSAPPKRIKSAPALDKRLARSPLKKPPAPATISAGRASAAAPDLPETAPEPLLALPLDAQTLLVRWKPVPARGKGERWELEVSSNGQPVRTIAVKPQSRQAYVRALAPGPVYRARLVARDSEGRSRVIGSPSRPVVFFPQLEALPSTERFVRYSWADPASSATGPDQPTPGDPMPTEQALAALGMDPASRSGAATSPSGPMTDTVVGAPLGWLLSSRSPTSFAN